MGFGDECNSLPVSTFLQGSQGENAKSFENLVALMATTPFALPLSLVVRPLILCDESTSEVEESVQGLRPTQKEIIQSAAKRRNGAILLDCSRIEGKPNPDDARYRSQYYSAYVWVIFVLVHRTTGAPVFAHTDEPSLPCMAYFPSLSMATLPMTKLMSYSKANWRTKRFAHCNNCWKRDTAEKPSRQTMRFDMVVRVMTPTALTSTADRKEILSFIPPRG